MASWLRPSMVALSAVALLVLGCSSGEDVTPRRVPLPTGEPPPAPSVSATPAAPAPPTTVGVDETVLVTEELLTGFEQPVLVVPYPDPGGSEQAVAPEALVVVDQPGRLWLVDGGPPSVFLDLRGRVRFSGEQGLLGVAFAPSFPDDARVFVDYVGRDGDTRISEFRVDPVRRVADPGTERVVLRVDQPAANHNGGMIAFGPDGNLWIGMGDGGAAGDRFHNGQDPFTLLGAMLRIDVTPDAPDPYGIPPDNPFADGTRGAPEVWAIGLRNPWRWAFDGADLWIADVGQDQVEEVDLLAGALDHPGVNFGWPVWEGDRCFAGPCGEGELAAPLATYGHDEGCSIIGGRVYRGSDLPELDGLFFFSDFCAGFLRSVDVDGTIRDWTGSTGPIPGVTSFGVDGRGELLLTTMDGRVLRLRRG